MLHHLLAAKLEFDPKCFFVDSGKRRLLILSLHWFLRCLINVCASVRQIISFSHLVGTNGGRGDLGVNGSLAPLNGSSTFWAGFILGTRCVMNTFLLPFNCGHLLQCYSNGRGIIASLRRESKRPSQSWSQMDCLKLMRLTALWLEAKGSPALQRRFHSLSSKWLKVSSTGKSRSVWERDKSCQIAPVKRSTKTIITIPIKIDGTFFLCARVAPSGYRKRSVSCSPSFYFIGSCFKDAPSKRRHRTHFASK